jgi:hypothetical protein
MFDLNLKQKCECQGILPKNGRPHHRGVKKTKIVSKDQNVERPTFQLAIVVLVN